MILNDIMKKDLVSIIMPCHNGGLTIADAIKSVQNQTFLNWELLVVDDASTDASVRIVLGFANEDSRIKLLHTESSTGLPATPRNVGINVAKGRYIAFLDCDDEWLPTKLERQLPLFAMRNVVVVFSYYGKMDADGRLHSNCVVSPAFVSYGKLLGGNVIGNLTGVYDTQKTGKVFQKEIRHEDYVMWLEILRGGFWAINTNTVEAVYRKSKSSVSGSKLAALGWTWQIYRRELQLSFFVAVKCFVRYAFKAVFKFIK